MALLKTCDGCGSVIHPGTAQVHISLSASVAGQRADEWVEPKRTAGRDLCGDCGMLSEQALDLISDASSTWERKDDPSLVTKAAP